MFFLNSVAGLVIDVHVRIVKGFDGDSTAFTFLDAAIYDLRQRGLRPVDRIAPAPDIQKRARLRSQNRVFTTVDAR